MYKLEDIVKPRDKGGRFVRGYSYSVGTQFKRGESRRKPKPYWDKQWLKCEYWVKNKSADQIAREQECRENNILYFLNKHNISRKTMEYIRARKYWGLKGKTNGMYGRIGKDNPNWNGGNSPERQTKYARSFWKELAKSILKRDGYICVNCSSVHQSKNKLIVHHIKEWSKYPDLRFNSINLITLCERCHKECHRGGDLRFSVNG